MNIWSKCKDWRRPGEEFVGDRASRVSLRVKYWAALTCECLLFCAASLLLFRHRRSCILGGTRTDSGLPLQNSWSSSKLVVSAPVFMDQCPEPVINVSPCVSNLPWKIRLSPQNALGATFKTASAGCSIWWGGINTQGGWAGGTNFTLSCGTTALAPWVASWPAFACVSCTGCISIRKSQVLVFALW